MAITTYNANSANNINVQSPQTQQLMALIQQMATQAGGYTGVQAKADTAGLNAAAVRDFQNSILPNITGAAEDAGASGGALTALLAQEAGIASAGNVAKLQLDQILGAEKLQSQEKSTNLNALLSMLQSSSANDLAKLQFSLEGLSNQFSGNTGRAINTGSPASSSQYTIDRGPTPGMQTRFSGSSAKNNYL